MKCRTIVGGHILMVATTAVFMLSGVATRIDLSEYEDEWDSGIHEVEWYDSAAWFDRGGVIEYETDWAGLIYRYDYDDTYHDVQGYYPYDSNNSDRFDCSGSDYYTGDWWKETSDFDGWYTCYDKHVREEAFQSGIGQSQKSHQHTYKTKESFREVEPEQNGRLYEVKENKKREGLLEQQIPTSENQEENLYQVRCSIKEMKLIQLTNPDESHVVARVRISSGCIVKFDLGPQQVLTELDLKEGDYISIKGSRGTINEKPMLIAHLINADNRTAIIRRSSGVLQRFNGTVFDTRTVFFRKYGVPDQLLARIKLEDGRTTVMSLGAKKDFPEDLNIRHKKFAVLARKVSVGEKQALIAEHLRVDDRTITVP